MTADVSSLRSSKSKVCIFNSIICHMVEDGKNKIRDCIDEKWYVLLFQTSGFHVKVRLNFCLNSPEINLKAFEQADNATKHFGCEQTLPRSYSGAGGTNVGNWFCIVAHRTKRFLRWRTAVSTFFPTISITPCHGPLTSESDGYFRNNTRSDEWAEDSIRCFGPKVEYGKRFLLLWSRRSNIDGVFHFRSRILTMGRGARQRSKIR